VAADAAGEGKFLEELKHPLLVLTFVWVDLRIGTLQINRRQNARRTVARASQEDGIEVVLVNQSIQMNVGEAQTGAGAPVTQEALLDVLCL
jgi:hypothetical protein